MQKFKASNRYLFPAHKLEQLPGFVSGLMSRKIIQALILKLKTLYFHVEPSSFLVGLTIRGGALGCLHARKGALERTPIRLLTDATPHGPCLSVNKLACGSRGI